MPQDPIRLAAALTVSLLLHAATILWQPPAPAKKPPPPRMEVKLPAPDTSTDVIVLEESNTLDPPEPAKLPEPPEQKPAPAKPGRLTQKQENRILHNLSDVLVYPQAAVDAGHEGTVLLLLIMRPDGTLQSASIAASSGHAELDEAALHAVSRLPRFDAGGKKEFIFPMTFRLQ